MTEVRWRWGVELNGDSEEQKRWKTVLRSPFDPFVDFVNSPNGEFLALLSSSLNELGDAQAVHEAATELLATLNVVMSKTTDSDPLALGAVVDFSHDPPRRHHILRAEGITLRLRLGIPELTVRDTDGNVIPPIPAPTRAQLWMRAATVDSEIGAVLRYLAGSPGWIELYKAFEALQGRPRGTISKSELDRFAQTANSVARHHPTKTKPHKRPMEIWEARALLTQWVSVAIEDVLARNP